MKTCVCGRRHSRELDAGSFNVFLTYLAVDMKISASAQSQALQALLFLYREVLTTEEVPCPRPARRPLTTDGGPKDVSA